MNTNVAGNNGYHANVQAFDEDGNCLACWGFSVHERHGKVFTVKLAKELLELANEKYKEVFPDREAVTFTSIRYDMSDYRQVAAFEGGEDYVTDFRRIGTYNSKNNVLRIFENDLPVYENSNGVICRDSEALADDLC